MIKLAKPNKILASRILTEVDYREHIMGYQLSERGGARPVKLYSFEEVVNLLNAPHPRLDFEALLVWVQDVMNDLELTSKLKTIFHQDVSDYEKSLQCRELMEQRLAQSKAVG
jgi:hypothetical protein